MSASPDPYAPISQRDFRQAILTLLETEYKILGSHRVLEMVVRDIIALHDAYYPPAERFSPGDLLWTTTAAPSTKGRKVKPSSPMQQITLNLPWVTPDDLTALAPENHRSERQRNIARAVRLVKAAYAAGALLTQAELAVLFNVSPVTMSEWLSEHYQQTAEVLPTKGQVLDIGCQPSHKDKIVYLYEQKVVLSEIARQTHHDETSVERYIQDYDRVKLLLGKGMSLDEIGHVTGRRPSTIRQYCTLIWHYHPELCPAPVTDTTSTATKT